MSVTWDWLLLACLLAFVIKLSGYLLPARLLEGPRMLRTASAMTLGLLAALVTVNTLATASTLTFDARLASLGVAALALWRRVSFLPVVLLGAAAAAVLRFFGIG